MKLIKFITVALMTCVLMTNANAVVAAHVNPTKEIAHGRIIIRDETPFSISLPRNASTGYIWILRNPEVLQFVKPISYKYETNADKKLVGSGGQDVWVFAGRKEYFVMPIMVELHFVYVRAWEANQEPAETAMYTVVMVPGK